MRWFRWFPFAGPIDRLLSCWLEAIAPELWQKVHRRDFRPESNIIPPPDVPGMETRGEKSGAEITESAQPRDTMNHG